MPDRLTRVFEVMRASSWSFWLSVSGDDGKVIGTPFAGVVLPAGMICVNTGMPFWVMTNVTSSVVTLGLKMAPVIVAVPLTGTFTGIGRPAKAKSVDAVVTKAGRPLSSSVVGSTVTPLTAV